MRLLPPPSLFPYTTLFRSDLRPIAVIAAEGKPQSPGAPLPEVLPPPHECRVVDVSDYHQVLEAARGMDALVNCTVVRPERDRKSTRLNSSHRCISYAVFCLKDASATASFPLSLHDALPI